MYSGYVFKFNFYARHALHNNEAIESPFHGHTWNVAISIESNDNFSEFLEVEDIISLVISEYKNKQLNELPPFDMLSPTLENIGEVLFEKINLKLSEYNISAHKLEISETPSRIFIVSPSNAPKHENKILASRMLKTMQKSLSSLMSENRKIKNTEIIIENTEPIEPVKEEYKPEPVNIIREKMFLKTLAALLTIFTCGLLLLYYINLKGNYPWGSDVYGHIFKADLLYNSMKEGNFYPLYTNMWYNGLQPFRYWAPIPYYILASMQFLSAGNPIIAYNLFVVLCFVGGALGWLLWGVKENKILLATFLGMLSFCMPDNIRVFFSEGNIPRVVIALLLPYVLYFIWQYLYYNKKSAIIPIMLLTSALSLCHLMITAMFGIAIFIYLLFYSISNRIINKPLEILIGMVIGILLCGIWLYPALQGGLLSLDQEATSEVMKSLTFTFTQSLNPFLRFKNIEIYYFGLSFLIISLLGIFTSNRKSIPGFLTLIIIFLGTTTSMVPFLIKLPLSQLLWMMRFTPIAYSIFIISILMWKNIRKYTAFILMALIFIDSMASFKILAFNSTPNPDTINMYEITAENTSQRAAILDLSEFGSLPSYYLTTIKHLPYAYGWAWQGASTAQNIVQLNTALENEYYGYMFDRSLELGCDTVLVKKDKVKDTKKLFYNANLVGYHLLQEFNNGYLFKIDIPKQFGMFVKYPGLAIGMSSPSIIMEFPSFQIANNNYIDEYSESELMQYEILYLSGFLYHDRQAAENLLLQVAKKGVKIVIDMNRVPNDPITNRMKFLGVTAQPIQFENRLPDLHLMGRVTFPIEFKKEYKKWNTVYLEGLPDPQGFAWFGGNRLDFFGRHENPNISFVGFNILFHAVVNDDKQVIDANADIIGQSARKMPIRTIIPIDIEYKHNEINIKSEANNYNTTLANLDAFVTSGEIYSIHNLLFAKDSNINIKITYPYLKEGIILSSLGFFLAIIFIYFMVYKKTIFRKRKA